jgi:hypothetical protein
MIMAKIIVGTTVNLHPTQMAELKAMAAKSNLSLGDLIAKKLKLTKVAQ